MRVLVCIYVYVGADRAVNHPMIARNSTCDLSVLRLNYANSVCRCIMLSTGYEMPKLPIGKIHMYLHVMNIN